MRIKRKKLGCRLLALVMLVTLLAGQRTQVAQAATATNRVPIICYAISTGRVTTYQSVNGAYSGYIDGASDQIRILNVYSNGWCRVKYPTSRGYKTAYTKSSNLFCNTNFSDSTTTIGQRKTVYRRANLSQSLGTVYADDQVVIIGTSGNNTQIIYPVSGGYKMGWISGKYSANSSSGGSGLASVADGYYVIKSIIDTKYVLDVHGISKSNGANIEICQSNGGLNQIFKIKKESDGYYSLASAHAPDKRVDVDNGGRASGTNILQWENNGGNNQRWKIEKTSDGYYSFVSKCNGLYMDVYGAVVSNGGNVCCYAGNGSIAQKFVLQSTSVSGSSNSNTSESSFQMPLDNARCTWSGYTNWSWGNHSGGSGSRVYHLGVDIIGSNDNVKATANGEVARAGWNSANGNYVVLKHNLSGQTVYSFYAHLASRAVSQSQTVSKGTVIGTVGSTGSASYGKHLHFAMMNTLWNGNYYGYATYFTGNKTTYAGVTYYNPVYVIENHRLP